jgi:Rieske Fe-S protein
MRVMTTQSHGSGRRTVLLGAGLGAGLIGIAGAVAGCSTAPVPYGANEAGVVEDDQPTTPGTSMPGTSMPSTGTMSSSAAATPGMAPATSAAPSTSAAPAAGAMTEGTVLSTTKDIPVGGGTIFTAEKVVVTQPVKGEFHAFSAVCTHVGCILDKVANGTIDCPCHGGEFTITTGAVVAGPPPTPLPKRSIKIEEGKVILL